MSVAACSGTQSGTAPSEAAGGSEIKVGILHSLSGTMAISEVTVQGRRAARDRGDQRGRRRARQEARARRGGRRLRLADLRREGHQADPAGQGRHRLRRLDLGQPQGDAAGLRDATRRCCGTRCSTRGWRARRTSSTPAPPPTSRSSPAWTTSRNRARRRSSWSAPTTSSRAPPTRSSRRTRRRTAWRSSARSTPRSATPSTARWSTRSIQAKPDVVFNTLNGDSNVAFFKQLKSAGHHRRRACRCCR